MNLPSTSEPDPGDNFMINRARAGANDRPHVPQRPIWLCRVCLTEWPCVTARTRLPMEYVEDPAGLSVYLATMLQQAIDDLYRLNPQPGQDPQWMYIRFLAWAAPRMRVARSSLGIDRADP